MSSVFFMPSGSPADTVSISRNAGLLFRRVLDTAPFASGSPIPLKVHVGEKGNTTFIRPDLFDGVIDVLAEKGLEGFFTDTNVLYPGQRTTGEKHVRLAREHGFTRLPMVIADGENGDEYDEIEIGRTHFRTAKIGRVIARADQMVVISHFKGHMLAGFGGAVKQLAMGCGSRGGKLAMHAGARPFINPFACSQCGTCAAHCPADAIIVGRFSRIRKDRCIGCAACSAVCPKGAVLCNFLHSLSKTFPEKLAEYALAAQQGKKAVYLSYALNITANCDCAGKPMSAIAPDIGVFASADPVAIDQACLDTLAARTGKKLFAKGIHALEYAEEIGLGSRKYELITIAGE